jgi:ubiquinone/menaquinone biosynthesis C-methylase UbiE
VGRRAGRAQLASHTVKSKELYPPIFSRHAAAYKARLDEIMARQEARGRARVIELLEVRPGMKVLDLACGPGTLSKPLAALAAPHGEVVGVDLAEGMLALAREAGISNARFEVMDIERLTYADATFDAVACGHGLQFAPDLDRALGEARRVLRPGGRFAASVPVSADSPAWVVIDRIIDRWLPPAPKASDQSTTRSTVNDAGALEAAARGAGFAEAFVEALEEKVRWDSAEDFVARCMSWWDLAARIDGVSDSRRDAFRAEAVTAMRREFPGAIETSGHTHVLWAVA